MSSTNASRKSLSSPEELEIGGSTRQDSLHHISSFSAINWTLSNLSQDLVDVAPDRQTQEVEERQNSVLDEWSFALPPSPKSGPVIDPRLPSQKSSINIIDLADSISDCIMEDDDRNPHPNTELKRYHYHPSGSFSIIERDDPDGVWRYRSSKSALFRSVKQRATEEVVLIDLDGDSVTGEEEPDFEFIRAESISFTKNSRPRTSLRRPSTRITYAMRNLPIVSPFECLKSITIHSKASRKATSTKLAIRPGKTVELRNGDFLRIKTIVQNAKTGEVTLRGHRFLFCTLLNGMLEKKHAEVCQCYEVDLDDPREPAEQSVVEAPIADVIRFRNLRWTNDFFPNSRNIDLGYLKEDQLGLTVRWRYTCTFPTAADRYRNNYKERSLERIRESDEGASVYKVSDEELRNTWRGKTVRGGAYCPTVITGESQPTLEGRESDEAILIESDSDLEVANPMSTRLPAPFNPEKFKEDETSLVLSSLKRKANSSPASSDTSQSLEERAMIKRRRYCDSVEEARRRLSNVHINFDNVDFRRFSIEIGLPSDSARNSMHLTISSTDPATEIGGKRFSSSETRQRMSLSSPDGENKEIFNPPKSPQRLSSLPPEIDLTSSDLSLPPQSGYIDLAALGSSSGSLKSRLNSPSQQPYIRTPGQALTYGDAFCGCGGATRGAVMAGLRVKWGLDHWDQACNTWRANFPEAECYQMSSEEFVSMAKGSMRENRPPVDVKVDILHLSPPCQYFSPAHTTAGQNDEMNIASLFAVLAVVTVAKPRVVTLEQTFGILYPKFRYYFNALVHMFTTLNFSLRWAVQPLAQWVYFLSLLTNWIGLRRG